MVYNIKEYKTIFDTPAKKEQELAVASKIMDLLNKKKFDNLDEFITRTPNYQSFLKENAFENVVKHFGNTISEQDFIQIIENLKILTKNKQDFNEENIQTTKIEQREFNSYKGEDKTYFLDNSDSDKSIEEQLEDLQPTQQNFQTSDMEKNTENMFKELEKNKKQSLAFQYLNEIDVSKLSYEEQELYNIAANYQIDNKIKIRIDLSKGVFIDEDENIMTIEKENGNFIIKGDQNTDTNEISQEQTMQKQFVLKPNQSSIYNNRKED